jgi:hypothetical protein
MADAVVETLAETRTIAGSRENSRVSRRPPVPCAVVQGKWRLANFAVAAREYALTVYLVHFRCKDMGKGSLPAILERNLHANPI